MTRIRGLLFVVPLAMLVAVVAPAANGASVAVSIRNTGTTDWAFQPRSVTIQVGDSVTWTNRSDAGSEPHTVTPDSGGFRRQRDPSDRRLVLGHLPPGGTVHVPLRDPSGDDGRRHGRRCESDAPADAETHPPADAETHPPADAEADADRDPETDCDPEADSDDRAATEPDADTATDAFANEPDGGSNPDTYRDAPTFVDRCCAANIAVRDGGTDDRPDRFAVHNRRNGKPWPQHSAQASRPAPVRRPPPCRQQRSPPRLHRQLSPAPTAPPPGTASPAGTQPPSEPTADTGNGPALVGLGVLIVIVVGGAGVLFARSRR